MNVETWDDFRFVLAVSRAGTLTSAAERLGCDQTTVTRRLKALEERLEMTLFDRLRGGIELTSVGEAFARTAELLEDSVLDLEREVSGQNSRLTGRLRVTLPELMAIDLFPEFERFTAAHPGIALEIVGSNTFQSLARREADVAIRITNTPAPHLVGRKVGYCSGAMYATRELAKSPMVEIPWIGWDPSDGNVSYTDTVRLRTDPEIRYALRVNTYLMLLEATRQGVGASLLPCMIGDPDPNLVRLTDPEVFGPIWILTHADLRRSPRVRALVDHMTDVLVAQRDVLSGEVSTV